MLRQRQVFRIPVSSPLPNGLKSRQIPRNTNLRSSPLIGSVMMSADQRSWDSAHVLTNGAVPAKTATEMLYPTPMPLNTSL